MSKLHLRMLYERQRLLLTLLDALREPPGHTDFQKLLFLYTQEDQPAPASYEFVPYLFGAFSFTSYADKRRLIKAGLLADDDQTWWLTDEGRSLALAQPVERSRVAAFCKRHAGLRGNSLIAEAYRRYPYYATRSEILHSLRLEPDDLARIKAARPVGRQAGLATIGYEDRSLEAYLNELLRSGVTLLCDVRRNPLSRKYGFSKSTLSNACAGVGIRYEHLPQLGIASAQRRGLRIQADYDALFAVYERDWLPQQVEALGTIRHWLIEGERVALTCYERSPDQCHRHCVAEALNHELGSSAPAQHL